MGILGDTLTSYFPDTILYVLILLFFYMYT